MAALHAAAFPGEAWDAAAFQLQLAMHGVLGFMDARGGLILLRITLDEAEILTLGVHPRARRKGIAGGLLRAAMAEAAQLGARSLFLEVAVGNVAARALYARAGFTEVGRRRAYYANGADALLLRADLSPPEPLG
ncbi:N-acetyltransferase GCN5 [Acidisoma sp. C75]